MVEDLSLNLALSLTIIYRTSLSPACHIFNATLIISTLNDIYDIKVENT